MNPFLIAVISLIALFILFQIYVLIKPKRSVGIIVPYEKIDSEIANKIKDKKSLLYFHSPSCHNCKTQTPIIEKLKKEFESIISVDTTKNLKTARTFNVMGTPSLLFLGSNKIKGFYVGVKNEVFIREKLQII